MRVLLILVDGMRPDALANVPQAQEMLAQSSYTLAAETVMPSVTLPCHMSLFHSVDPARHGITTNVYVPQVRPIRGLCEVLSASGKTCSFFYNWEELRDLSRPGSLTCSWYCRGSDSMEDASNERVTQMALRHLTGDPADFVFVYLGHVDNIGHRYGWMSPEYQESVCRSWENITHLRTALSGDWSVIVTADHGGHDRSHGTDVPEDMHIPLLLCGPDFAPGRQIQQASIRDIAPTITALLDAAPDASWEGASLL